MKYKKYFLLINLLFIILLSGCGTKIVPMDQLNEDGVYNYRNPGLGFSINLPSEFIYYQTQRKDGSDYTDLEILVPTSDINYPQEIQSYARPIVVRVYTKEMWEKLRELDQAEGLIYLLESEDRVYAVKFWQEVPQDWQDKWSDDMRVKIVESFKIL